MQEILVPIVTPFCGDGSMDEAALRALVRHVLSRGADGLYVCGTSAECYLMTPDERKRVLECAVRAADGAFVVAHVGAVGSDVSEDLARHAAQAGADAIASVPPFAYAFTFDEVYDYYRMLGRSTRLPLMLYAVSQSTGRSFTADQFERLLGIDGVQYVKYTETDYFTMERLKSHTGKFVYSGKDECFLSALAAGADGGIGTSFNLMPEKFRRILSLYRAGRMEEALEVQHEVNEVVYALLQCGLLESCKYLLARQGVDCGHARRPFARLTEAARHTLDEVYETYLR